MHILIAATAALGLSAAQSPAGWSAEPAASIMPNLSAPPRHASPVSRGWLQRGANPKHVWIYVAGSSGNVIEIFDLTKLGTPKIGEITQGVNNAAGMAEFPRPLLRAA
jgi:hypothetical protein